MVVVWYDFCAYFLWSRRTTTVVGLSIFSTKTKASTMSENSDQIRPYIVSTPSLVPKPHVFTPINATMAEICVISTEKLTVFAKIVPIISHQKIVKGQVL